MQPVAVGEQKLVAPIAGQVDSPQVGHRVAGAPRTAGVLRQVPMNTDLALGIKHEDAAHSFAIVGIAEAQAGSMPAVALKIRKDEPSPDLVRDFRGSLPGP